MYDDTKRVALFGIGPFEKELLRALSLQFHLVAVDMNEGLLKSLAGQLPGVQFLVGDASSILTWKRIPVGQLLHIISAIHDMDVNVELCRIVREIRQLDIPITIIAPAGPRDEQRLQQYTVLLLNPVEIGIQAIANRLRKNYTLAGGIGLGKGELIEVPILTLSHLVGKTLSMLRPKKWHVAGIYRNNQLLIPNGNTQIRLKDRILLFGDPVVVDNIACRMLQGNPLFPLQFGSQLVIAQQKNLEKHSAELGYLRENIKVQKLIYCPPGEKKRNRKTPVLPTGVLQELNPVAGGVSLSVMLIRDEDIGLFFLPFSSSGFFPRRRLHRLLRSSRKPLFLSRNSFPYDSIVVSLNCPEPASALELGIDLARLFKVPLVALHAILPRLLRSEEDEVLLKERIGLIEDFENIHKMKIPFSLLEGNPVRSTLAELQKHPRSLCVLLYSAAGISSFFRPHIQSHIAQKTTLSTLLVPYVAVYES